MQCVMSSRDKSGTSHHRQQLSPQVIFIVHPLPIEDLIKLFEKRNHVKDYCKVFKGIYRKSL